MIIAKTGNSIYPVAMLEAYLSETGTLLNDQRYLFSPICKSSRSEKLRDSGCITYACLKGRLQWKMTWVYILSFFYKLRMACPLIKLKCSVLLVMYNWLNGFYRVMNGKYSITLLFFGSNTRRASLLRPRPSTVSIASGVQRNRKAVGLV